MWANWFKPLDLQSRECEFKSRHPRQKFLGECLLCDYILGKCERHARCSLSPAKFPVLAVAQRQERRAVNAKTMGSIPSSRPNTKAKEKERDDRQISKDKGGKRDDTLGAATSSLERKGMTRNKRAKYHVRTRRFLNREL